MGSSVLVRLREPVVSLPQAEADRLFKLGIIEKAAEYRTQDPAEPEALVRFLVSTMAAGSYYNQGEIVGLKADQAEWYVEKRLATHVTPAERDAAVADARAKEAARGGESELVLVRFARSWAVFGSYYNAGEVAGFRGDQAKVVLDARFQDGVNLRPFAERLSAEEVEALHQAQATPEPPTAPVVLVRFKISMTTAGSYYNAGEVGGFSREKAAELLAARTLAGDPFVELVEGIAPVLAASEPRDPVEIPEGVDVAGLTDRDPDGVAEAQEKALDRPPKNRMVDSDKSRRK